MENKLPYVSIMRGYEPNKRFSVLKDTVSRTVQDAIVDIPTLMKEFKFQLDDLFNHYNNGLLYESEIGVFVDELNEKELSEFNRRKEESERLQREKEENDRLFEEWKREKAKAVFESRSKSDESE